MQLFIDKWFRFKATWQNNLFTFFTFHISVKDTVTAN